MCISGVVVEGTAGDSGTHNRLVAVESVMDGAATLGELTSIAPELILLARTVASGDVPSTTTVSVITESVILWLRSKDLCECELWQPYENFHGQ
jgi:hypothetical protein